jgi:uncharacterized protein
MKSYDYTHRRGVRQITWEEFVYLARGLSELIEPYHPEVVLGIARAGLFPATLVACNLRCEFFPIRLTRRVNDQVVNDHPIWKIPIPPDVTGKAVVVIDEIADTGETLSIASKSATKLGAKQVVTACMVSHSWADPAPQISVLVSDEFIVFPWDAQVLDHGRWVIHPEVEAGLKAQIHNPKN